MLLPHKLWSNHFLCAFLPVILMMTILYNPIAAVIPWDPSYPWFRVMVMHHPWYHDMRLLIHTNTKFQFIDDWLLFYRPFRIVFGAPTQHRLCLFWRISFIFLLCTVQYLASFLEMKIGFFVINPSSKFLTLHYGRTSVTLLKFC